MSFYKGSKADTDADVADEMLSKIRDLLIEHNQKTGSAIPTEYNLELSKSQKVAYQKFKRGENILILGSAGCGKSRLVKEFYKITNRDHSDKNMYITSTTGISAYNIGGITINSFMGIGTGEASVQTILKRLQYKIGLKDRIRRTDILVIDEISMMSASIFEKIDQICKTLRKSNKPFGGIQIVLTGDFLQLETVFNKDNLYKNNGYNKNNQNETEDTRLIIESELFQKMFEKNTINLNENFRQNGDSKYVDLLMRIRKGEHTQEDLSLLKTRLKKIQKYDIVHLVSSNKKAQAINMEQLHKIQENDHYFESIYTRVGHPETCDLLEKELRSQFEQKGLGTLQLRKGCRVLLIKNLDVSKGLVNGSTGVVTDIYSESVKVLFDNKITEIIGRSEWELEMDNARVTCTQIPLILAYSITIHKSQSLGLDSAILDLADCFCNHMVYVALSRVRSLEGVYLKTFNPAKITVNQKLLEFINNIEEKCLL